MYKDYNVLFVDDEINILNSLRRGLIDEEYTCHFASSGLEALEIMKNEKIAVIVSDMRMPEMDGLQLLKQIKEKWPNTVRIVLSGYTQLQQILTTINQVDVFKFITKPWKMEEEFKHVIYQSLDYFILIELSEKNKITIEKKNLALQNMLTTMNNLMSKTKSNMTILSEVGLRILEYNEILNFEISPEIGLIQKMTYQDISKALFDKEIEYSVKHITDNLSSEIFKNLTTNIATNIKNNTDDLDKYSINISIVQVLISLPILIFKDFYIKNGMRVSYVLKSDKSLNISAVSTLEKIDIDSSNDLIKKIELLNKILNPSLQHMGINYSIVINDDAFGVIIQIFKNK